MIADNNERWAMPGTRGNERMGRILQVVGFLTMAIVASASAQISSEFLGRWGLEYRFDRNSARLDALVAAGLNAQRPAVRSRVLELQALPHRL